MINSNKRFLFLSLILVFALSFVWSLNVVSAASGEGIIKTIWDSFFGGIDFGSGPIGSFPIGQILLVLLVVMLVYSVTDFLPFLPEKDWLKWVFSSIVGILAFLFIDKETVNAILTSYTAMGVALTAVIPLLILLAFSFKISSKPQFAGFSVFLDKFLFLVFGLWMLFKWKDATDYSNVYFGSMIIALLYIFLGKVIRRLFNRSKVKIDTQISQSEGANEEIDSLRAENEDIEERIKKDKNPKGLAGRNKQRLDLIERNKQKINALSRLVD